MRVAAEPTCQPPTATTNAQWLFLANLLEEIGRLRIVAVFSGPTEQTFDFSTVPCVTTIEERDSKMILSFLAAVLGRVVGPDRTDDEVLLAASDAASFRAARPASACTFLRKLDHRLRRQARCKCLQDGGRNLPIASLAPERHIGIDRRGAAGGQVAGKKRGAD
jgi:hypothetical protein